MQNHIVVHHAYRKKATTAHCPSLFTGEACPHHEITSLLLVDNPEIYRNFATIMTPQQRLHLEEETVRMLKTVFDPEIPVDVYSLGLIYKIDISDEGNVAIDMTLTAPNCPMGDFLFEDIRQKVESIEGVKSVNVQLVFEPEWDQSMMSEEAKLELGML